MKTRDSVLSSCAALMVLCASGKAEHGAAAPNCVVTAPSAVPGLIISPGDPHQYDEPSDAAGNWNPSFRGLRKTQELANAIGLTDVQAGKIELIFTQEATDLNALGPGPMKAAEAAIKQRARDQIRAQLTLAQRARFNLISQKDGGGLVGKSPWEQLDRLDQLVHLTPAQKKPLLDEFVDLTENLMEAQGPEQAARAQQIRLVITEEIRALLTPEQRKNLDAALEKHPEKSSSKGNS